MINLNFHFLPNRHNLLKYDYILLSIINLYASPSAGAPALKYRDVNTETTSPGEVKGLI